MIGNIIAGENGVDPYTSPVPECFMLPSALNMRAGFDTTIKVTMMMYVINATVHRGIKIMT